MSSDKTIRFEVELVRQEKSRPDGDVDYFYSAWIGDVGGDSDKPEQAVADAVNAYLFDLALR